MNRPVEASESAVDSPQSGVPTVLLVDDEENILAALRRLLRRDGYRILVANSGAQALEVLASEDDVDVIVSDQRMPAMTGTEFLRQARKISPNSMRIVLSGYTELESVTSAINDGAVYKFLTKPWDDAQLRAHIADAIRRKRLDDENRRLQVELAKANATLLQLLEAGQRRIEIGEASLSTAQWVLASLPVGVIGIDVDGVVILANDLAESLLGCVLVGANSRDALPSGWLDGPAEAVVRSAKGQALRVVRTELRIATQVRGQILTLMKELPP